MDHPVLDAVRRARFAPLGWFTPTAADGLPRGARGALLIGSAGPAMFERFAAERDAARASLDDWTRDVVMTLARGVGVAAIFPFDRPPPPFLAWARRAGVSYVSPLGLNIHPVYGLWHAYRAALVFRDDIDLPPVAPSASPCDGCPAKPCLAACPVGAFSPTGYDVAACAGHLLGPGGTRCMTGGCLARHACPVGQDFAYAPVQAAFHMRAFRSARSG